MQKIILVFFFLPLFLFAQSKEEKQLQFAHQLFNEEKYFDAITEAKRFLFFNIHEDKNFEAYLLIAKSYRAGAKFSDALRFFLEAEKSALNIDQLFSAKIEAVKIHIIRRSASVAIKKIEEMLVEEKFILYKEELNYWKGWAHIFDDNWKSAAESFRTLQNKNEVLINLCESVENQKYSVSFAKTISSFIPGAGQFYTGNYLSGMLSLAYTTGFFYITAEAFLANRIFDALMVTNFLGFRFYRGNIFNAEKFAVQKNLEINNEALNFLQHEFKGNKP